MKFKQQELLRLSNLLLKTRAFAGNSLNNPIQRWNNLHGGDRKNQEDISCEESIESVAHDTGVCSYTRRHDTRVCSYMRRN